MNNFELIKKEKVSELNGEVKIYRHTKTGAEYISVENNDNNKVFGVTLRTPPSDSTGVAHILEHSVLCGSRKYPLKDPFVQLLKGSLQTFLNAMTYPDKTVYPVASQNVKDFYNLVDVYLDAVFFPRITPDFFAQEGWHYEMENVDAPLTRKGVVYNEMKGAYSSAENILYEFSQRELFPDNAYGLDSGGTPSEIPNLTYKKFKKFHETFYHPSNARLFFYGNDDPTKRMEILEEYLCLFEPLENRADSKIVLQKPFKEPALISKSYAADGNDAKAYISINWALPEKTDFFTMSVLDQILTGTSGSPLRKVLIESGLGEDLAGIGFESQLRQPIWSIGMKGVEVSNLRKVENLILKTLENIASTKINQNDIEAALNSFEFDLRENNHGNFPQGLSTMLTMLTTWLYNKNPIQNIAYEHPLKKIKESIKNNPHFFENLIKTTLLENKHRSTVHLLPNAKKAEQEKAEETKLLEEIRSKMNSDELTKVVEETARLLKMQETSDSSEAIKSLPLLKREDLNKEIDTTPREIEKVGNATVLFHDLFTGGITYIDIGFDLHSLSAEELPWCSLMASMLLEMGTQKESFDSLSKRIAQKTGGIYVAPMFSSIEDSKKSIGRLFIRAKCMSDLSDDLFSIINDILFLSDFDNYKRFKEILLEQSSTMESSVIPSAHSAVLSRLKSHYHEALRAAETMSGIDALLFHRKVIKMSEKQWPEILSKFNDILQKLLSSNLVINVTAEGKERSQITQKLTKIIDKFPTTTDSTSDNWNFFVKEDKSEALFAPTSVNYVGQSINIFDNGYKTHYSALVITKYLQTTWLWEKVRVQGGAYGAICSFNPNCGALSFASYRDPNLTETIEIYKKTGDFLKKLTLDDEELTRSIIGAIGAVDAYRLPDTKGYSDTLRYLTNVSDKKRQQKRDEILSTTQQNFNEFGEALSMDNAITSILGSKEVLCQIEFDNQIKVL